MKNRIEYILFLGLGFIVRLFSLNISRKFAVFIASVFYYIIPIRKKIVFKNLKNAFPNYNEKKISSIAFGSYKNFVIALIEILYIPKMTREEIKFQVNCENPQLIIESYNKKKGVILLSAHFGNWEYVAVSVSAQLNLPFTVIVKSQRNPFVNNWLNKARTRWENKIVPLGMSIRNVYEELKNKNIVAMVADQRGPEEGIKLEFFGQKTSVLTGPAILSLKTGAPILIGIPIRQPDYLYKLKMYEISMENLPEENDQKIIEISKRHIAYLEEVIKQHPEQWLWMHNRWRH